MRFVRIYDHSGRVVRELGNVIGGQVLRSGALVITTQEPRGAFHVVQAPGTWHSVDDWTENGDPEPAEPTTYAAAAGNGEPYDQQPAADPGPLLPPDPMPGSAGPDAEPYDERAADEHRMHTTTPGASCAPNCPWYAGEPLLSAAERAELLAAEGLPIAADACRQLDGDGRPMCEHAPVLDALAEPAELVAPVVPAGSDTGPRHAPVLPSSWAGEGLRALTRGPLPVDGMSLPDGARLRSALLVPCRCEWVRCPTVLNPSTEDERAGWRERMRGGAVIGLAAVREVENGSAVATLPEVEPYMRCVHEREHAGTCVWHEGGWPYGAAEHHPQCPRWHGTWNARFGGPLLAEPLDAAAVDEGMTYTRDMSAPEGGPLPDGVAGHAIGRVRCAAVSTWDGTVQCEGAAQHDGVHSGINDGGDRFTW